MTDTVTIVILAVLLVLVAWIATAPIWYPRWGRPRPAGRDLLAEKLREQFVVTLHSGETFRGLLEAQDARWVLLRQVEALQAARDGTTNYVLVDGELILPRDQIVYLQRP